jgi:hypothetical protein
MQLAPPKRRVRLLKNISEIVWAMVVSMHSAVVELQKCRSNRPSLQKWTSYAVAKS